jgi:hypothetical protein
MKKKYNISKLLLIFFLFAIPIYILYFNESENSKSILNLNETLKENYTNYVNICKNGEIPEFYNISATSLLKTIPLDGSGCNYYCDLLDNSLCDFFTIDNNNCKLYSGDSTTRVVVNCANKYQNSLPNSDKIISNYNGEGFVKSKFYYTDGSDAFTYNDDILEKANVIRDEMIDIQYLLNNRPDDDSIERKHLLIENIKASLAKYLDISMGNLFSTLSIGLNTFNKDAKTMKFDPNTDNLDEKSDISINPLFNMFKDLNKTLTNIDGTQEFNELEYNRRHLVYSVLLFLSVISIIILLLHKFIPNFISNITLMAYFIGVILIISFIHFLLKQ